MWVWTRFSAVRSCITMATAVRGSSWDPHDFSAPLGLPHIKLWPHLVPIHRFHAFLTHRGKSEESGLTFWRVLAKFFGFTCSTLPRMGMGAGPGGIFPFPDLHLHDAKESRQAMQTRRTTVAAPRSMLCFWSSGGRYSSCWSPCLYTKELC